MPSLGVAAGFDRVASPGGRKETRNRQRLRSTGGKGSREWLEGEEGVDKGMAGCRDE